ncbi:MarR family winged helix-turn-helix transcriptional regulator [Treponema zioleckii]|uniref:MarR family winged helix-turn-helix transcriptional regulator n=1 Tax=Treponema zioleckii TaxID=331680 RepID=UPI00168AE9F9|nr:MarR family transcriptional regulator [Treponema zioleckii]
MKKIRFIWNSFPQLNFRRKQRSQKQIYPDYDEYVKNFGKNEKSSEKKFGDNQKSSDIILELLKENPKLSAKKLSEKIGITSRAVEKLLATLVEKGFIKREGSPEDGHWEILK